MNDGLCDNLRGEELKLAGNNSLNLTDPGGVWVVVSGSMAVFAATCEAGGQTGSRRHLFTVSSGDALFGVAISGEASRILLAVSLEETELIRIRLQDLAEDWVRHQGQAAKFVSDWSQKIGSVLEGLTSLPIPDPQESNALHQQLSSLHSEFLRNIAALEERDSRQRAASLMAREEQLQSATRDVLGDLAAAARAGQGKPLPPGGAPLFAAVQALGQASGITVIAPKNLDPGCGAEEALRAIARNSHFRIRKVMLAAPWWKRDCGPILAFQLADGQPVALLPRGPNRYALFDPATGAQTEVDQRAAGALQPFGYVAYRPLPEKIHRPYDMMVFSLKGARRELTVILVTALAGTLLGMFTPIATSALIDSAIPDANRSLLLQMGMGLLAAAFGKSLFDLAEVFATTRISTRSNAVTQAAVWDRLLKLRPSFLRQFSTGDLSSRAMSISAIFQHLSTTSLRAIFSSFASLLNLALMFYYSVPLALIGLAAGVLIVVATQASGMAMVGRLRSLQRLEGRILGLTLQLINGISKLRVSGTERFAFAYWGKNYSEQQKLNFSVQRLQDYIGSLNQTIPTLATAAIFAVAGSMLFQPNAPGVAGLTPGFFLAFSAAFGMYISSLVYLSNTVVDALSAISLWDRSEPILTAEPEMDAARSDPGPLRGKVAMARVTFRYHDSGPLTIEDFSFRADPGEFVAIVGPSGSGKSTFVRLLLGFEKPTSGTIYYDGQDLNGLDVLAVRRQLGVVLQNSNLMGGPIFENIAAGTTITLDQAWEAARQAGIAEDIKALPMGMHTVISEGASNFSMGQRQRLLIARALVFRPRILLFDEATSALDNHAQAVVSESLERLKVTRIVIAHRLSTIRNADRIYVIENGRVAEEGTFAELAAGEGLFSRMMARQML
ncbi:MAG TPA: NHLP bacteriocin export ABC transporter permease/ATPase subunit [Terriglobia bacterium]|nr:NHLP bacteriocin export ABC transporter permease/ATPase subunit [Terriglobia bacterium]